MRASIPLLLTASAVLFMADARDARACDPRPSGVYGRAVLPEDGATGVPRNARVLVRYDLEYNELPGNTLSLRAQGGEVIEATVTETPGVPSARLISPAAPLAPSTTYEVLDGLISPCNDGPDMSCEGEPAVVSTFTTGSGLDTTPPRLTGVAVNDEYRCEPDNSCGPRDEIMLDVVIDGAEDDHDPAWVVYVYRDADGDVIAGPTSIVDGRRHCGGAGDGAPSVSSQTVVLPSDLTVRAIDLAGNEEVEPHRFVTATCAELDDGSACDKDPGGCSTGGGGGVASALAALLLLVPCRRIDPRSGRAVTAARRAGPRARRSAASPARPGRASR